MTSCTPKLKLKLKLQDVLHGDKVRTQLKLKLKLKLKLNLNLIQAKGGVRRGEPSGGGENGKSPNGALKPPIHLAELLGA